MTDSALWTSLITIAGVWLVTVISPGPNFLATAHLALVQSRQAGLWLSAGIALGTTIWAVASLLGLALLFQTAAWLYLAVKLAGGAYLIFMGLRMVVGALRGGPAGDDRIAGQDAEGLSPFQAFRRGLLTDLSNPKAALFFASLFAVAVPPDAPLWFGVFIVAVVVVMAGGWYAVVAWLVSKDPVTRFYRRASRAITVLTGAVFVGLGVRLVNSR